MAIVVPTIALMDETRRRLSKLSSDYKILTHGTQEPGERNLYVMTQERLLDLQELPNFDFFVVDEFYKLDPAHSDERSNRLNLLLKRLMEMETQFYLRRTEHHGTHERCCGSLASNLHWYRIHNGRHRCGENQRKRRRVARCLGGIDSRGWPRDV